MKAISAHTRCVPVPWQVQVSHGPASLTDHQLILDRVHELLALTSTTGFALKLPRPSPEHMSTLASCTREEGVTSWLRGEKWGRGVTHDDKLVLPLFISISGVGALLRTGLFQDAGGYNGPHRRRFFD